MPTWETFKLAVARKVADAEIEKYTEDELLDATNDALRAFASHHTAYSQTMEVAGDGTTKVFDLPVDVIAGKEIYVVTWGDKALEEAYPGEMTNGRSWFIWPNGKIQFSDAPDSSDEVTIYYNAYYPEIVDNTSDILVPGWALEAIKTYAAASLIVVQATKQATLANYKTRRDAGDPEDNPYLRIVEHHMEHYWQILAQNEVPQFRVYA